MKIKHVFSFTYKQSKFIRLGLLIILASLVCDLLAFDWLYSFIRLILFVMTGFVLAYVQIKTMKAVAAYNMQAAMMEMFKQMKFELKDK
jgi:biotin transporter BioY